MTTELGGLSRPQRWDIPFGPEMTDDDVDWLLLLPLFNRIDPDNFLPSLPLRGILRNDCRVRRFENGDIIVRQGDYGNSAFYISSGAVRVLMGEGPGLPASVLGRVESHKKTLGDAFRQLWTNPPLPEFRDLRSYVTDSRLGTRAAPSPTDGVHIFLQDVPGVLGKHKTARLEKGELFGEIAALGRSPRTATIFSDGPSEVLEIRWQGLRDLRRRAPELKRYINELYRTRSLLVQLEQTPLLRGLSRQDLARVSDNTVFETYGDFDWYGSYKALADQSAAVRLRQEPVIAEEGHYPNGLILIRAGFARLSEKHHNGERTVSYLGKGQSYGLEEIVHNARNDRQIPLQRTLRAMGYVDILLVPTSVMEKIVLPGLAQDQIPPPVRPVDAAELPSEVSERNTVPQDMLEFLGDNRFINGTATMMIDLDRCVRCDDCVRACAATHDNNPRFLRHGPQHGSYMVANACMQCIDPVCMIGCPTGAIHRSEAQGQVLINDQTCIGCSTCANSCPYDNIRMVEIRDRNGVIAIDTSTNMPILKATKCDLCIEQLTSPACERACPHDALKRVNMQDLPSLARWLKH